MSEAPYTLEDLEQYIEYSHKLYSRIVERFAPRVNIEDPNSTPVKDMKQFGDNLGLHQVINEVYDQTHEHFSGWLSHDCILTDHKGKEDVGIKPGLKMPPGIATANVFLYDPKIECPECHSHFYTFNDDGVKHCPAHKKYMVTV